jgi:hypothetical protein
MAVYRPSVSRVWLSTIIDRVVKASFLISTSSWLVRWLPLLAFCAVITHHLWFVSGHAINIPYQDDLYDFLRFVQLFEAAESPRDAFDVWFAQYNDHRTSASRALVYGAYLVEGEVNFRTLTLLANLALPLILMVFYFSVRDEKYRWLYLLVSALLLLSLRFHSIGLSSQPSFAYFFVFFYAFACLFALHRVTWPKFLLAGVLCTLATFTFASGQVAWLLGLASLAHQWWIGGRRSSVYAVSWLLLAVVVLLLWRIGFGEAPLQIPLASFPDQLIDPPAPVLQILARHAAWFLVILGCAFIDASTLWAGVAGLALVAALSYATLRLLRQDDLRLVLCGWFVVANAAAVSVGRARLLTPDYILHERYSFFSVLLLCILALLLQVSWKSIRAPVTYLAVLLAGVFWVWTYRHFESPVQDIQTARYAEFNRGQFWIVGEPLVESNAIVEQAIATGIYRAPCRPFPECESDATLQ